MNTKELVPENMTYNEYKSAVIERLEADIVFLGYLAEDLFKKLETIKNEKENEKEQEKEKD